MEDLLKKVNTKKQQPMFSAYVELFFVCLFVCSLYKTDSGILFRCTLFKGKRDKNVCTN